MSQEAPSKEMLENLDLLLEMDVLEEEDNWDVAEENQPEEDQMESDTTEEGES